MQPTPAPQDITLAQDPILIAGRYRVEGTLGEGGFGVVYKAREVSIERLVALKVLRTDRGLTAERTERFLREARVLRDLSHPHIVHLLDFGQTEDGAVYIALPLLDGAPLNLALHAQGPFSVERTAHITAQVLRALMAAHRRGMIHRDIKPSNIFISDFEGITDFVKLLDFGLAKDLDREELTGGLTHTGQLLGTPFYMAPEQSLGQACSPATDLYALGLVMAELLTGRSVYQETHLARLLLEQTSDDPVPLNPAVRAGSLGPIIERATRKKPAERYTSAQEMLADIERLALGVTPRTDPTSTADLPRRQPPPPTPRPPKPPRPIGLIVALIATSALALLSIALLIAFFALGIVLVEQEEAEEASSRSSAKGATERKEPTTRRRASRRAPTRKYDPRRFDAVAWLPQATALAREIYPDAALTLIDANGVWAEGHTDLTLTDDLVVIYTFRSPVQTRKTAKGPRGLDQDRPCTVSVIVNAREARAVPSRSFRECEEVILHEPRCSLQDVWKRAQKLGVKPRNAVANVDLLDSGWYFQLEGFSATLPDDCP